MKVSVKGSMQAARWADVIFKREGIRLTLGGEPTYVPENPEGHEWSFSAVGPTKLGYARRMADVLLRGPMTGGAVFFSPGKQYPGEVNPRWALRIVRRRDGVPVFRAAPAKLPATPAKIAKFLRTIAAKFAPGREWMAFKEPDSGVKTAWALPLDHEESEWKSVRWKLKAAERVLTEAEGPAGLRLPLYLLAPKIPRRALVAEVTGGRLSIFFPPLLQEPFSELLASVGGAFAAAKIGIYELQGYVPEDTEKSWTVLGLTADPGVLEVNLPACATWQEYDEWIRVITESAESVGLRSWKHRDGEHPGGTGGGNHLLWGGPSIEENPFFSRPTWLASILRHFQRHPSLAYLFTGCYVGASSQAPRPDESAKQLFDLEMACNFLESLPEGDHRALINETLRHLQTDVTGNAHRSETSFDKFWNPGWPGGMLGLIEFRAVESLPRAAWMSAIALLWRCIAALGIARPLCEPMRDFGLHLHDAFFLPTCLLADLEDLLDELESAGCKLPRDMFHEIWDWKFPRMLSHQRGKSRLEVRRANESWPLLCETPVEGGSTSRFVDTSMHRIEIRTNDAFAGSNDVYVHGRRLALRKIAPDTWLAGVRYRRSCLYPCLHPGMPIHLPLDLAVTPKGARTVASAYRMECSSTDFTPVAVEGLPRGPKPCRAAFKGALTHDLRLE